MENKKLLQLQYDLRRNSTRAHCNNILLLSAFAAYVVASFNNDIDGALNIIANIYLSVHLFVLFAHVFYYIAEVLDLMKSACDMEDSNISIEVMLKIELSWGYSMSTAFTRLLLIPSAMYIISRMIVYHSIWSYIIYGILALVLLFFYLLTLAVMHDIKLTRKKIFLGDVK